jgi:UDP-N-acetylmuramoylalanine--D-glutamate ligase
MGGYDKGNDYQPLIEYVRSKVKGLILLGSHTGIIRNALAAHVVTWEVGTMIDAVELAYSHAVPGDVVLLSPANASFDMFTDYKERGQAFREAVNHLESTEAISKSDIHLDQLSD